MASYKEMATEKNSDLPSTTSCARRNWYALHLCVLYVWASAVTLTLVLAIWVGGSELRRLEAALGERIPLEDLRAARLQGEGGEPDSVPMWSPHPQQETAPQGEGDDNSTRRRHRRSPYGGEGSGGNDDWMWINTYSRIPLTAMQEFCRGAKEYCAASGPPGPPGVPGQKGELGETGLPGEKGDPGSKGATPDLGLVAENLRSLDSMRGPPGERGDPGSPGPKGGLGEPGVPGPSGPPGPTGLPGVNGMKGDKGDKGNQGERGARGLLGFPGFEGDKGEPGPQGPPGRDGIPGKDGKDGFPGIPGEPGRNGTDGLTGRRGKKGDRGLSGPKGTRGISGTPGVPGLKGYKGDPGHMGRNGAPGLRGPKGDKGTPGYCEASCGKTRPTTTSTEATTTPTTTTPTTTTPEPTIPPRQSDCRISIIGKPLYQHRREEREGWWLMDAQPKSPSDANKIWVTPGFHGNRVLEFADSGALNRNQPAYIHTLGNIPYFGTGHVVYRGFLYYHWGNEDRIVRYDLDRKIVNVTRQLPGLVYSGRRYVFSRANTRVDFSADENGLWAVYARDTSDKLQLVRVDPLTLLVMKAWELEDATVGSYGNGFLACGVLYLVRSMDESRTLIDFAFDAYSETRSNPWLRFTNPYRSNSMVAYNPRSRLIFGWDSGKLITYPMLM